MIIRQQLSPYVICDDILHDQIICSMKHLWNVKLAKVSVINYTKNGHAFNCILRSRTQLSYMHLRQKSGVQQIKTSCSVKQWMHH